MKFLTMLLLTGKLSKVMLTGGTMLLSLVTYAWVFGWRYAAGLVGLLFAHEMGHYLAARHRGLDVGAPCFIPFVGAWINLKEQPMDAETEAFVALADPCLAAGRRPHHGRDFSAHVADRFSAIDRFVPLASQPDADTDCRSGGAAGLESLAQ